MINSIVDELRGAFNKPDNALMQIIVINILVFVALNLLHVILYLAGNNALYYSIEDLFSLPPSFSELIFKPWTIVTYFFVHTQFFHILFNMLFLYWFGQVVMEYVGNRRVISLYVLGGLAGALTFLLIYPFIPSSRGADMIGASAGVFAIVIGAATLNPDRTFFLLFIGPVKIKYIAAVYVLLAIFGLKSNNAGGELAHLGGALIGYLHISNLKRGTDIGAWVNQLLDYIGGFFQPKPKMRVSHKKAKVTTPSSQRQKSQQRSSNSDQTPNQEEIDAILDKISASGYDSLSKEEKQKLFKASGNDPSK